MTELTQEQLAEIRERDRRDHHTMELSGAQTAAAYRDDGYGGWRDSHYDRRALLHHIDAQAAKLAKVQELRGAIEAFMRSPQKKDDKARAWEFGNCIAYIKNGLDAILEGDSA